MKYLITLCLLIILFGCGTKQSSDFDNVLVQSEQQLEFALQIIEPDLDEKNIFPWEKIGEMAWLFARCSMGWRKAMTPDSGLIISNSVFVRFLTSRLQSVSLIF